MGSFGGRLGKLKSDGVLGPKKVKRAQESQAAARKKKRTCFRVRRRRATRKRGLCKWGHPPGKQGRYRKGRDRTQGGRDRKKKSPEVKITACENYEPKHKGEENGSSGEMKTSGRKEQKCNLRGGGGSSSNDLK